MAELTTGLTGAGTGAEGAGGNPPTDPKATNAGNGKDEKTKTYSQEDFEKALQSETDKRVAEALKTAQGKWEEGLMKRIEDERKDAAERAKMSAEQIAAADAEKAQKEFEAEREKYQREKLEFDVTRQLAEKKLPLKFSKFISAMGAENVDANIKELEAMLGDARQSIVEELTKGTPPKGGGKPSETDPFLSGFGK